MKLRQWITVVALSLLVIATVVGLLLTGTQSVLPARTARKNVQPAIVDQKPLQTARKLAALAVTPEERDFAHEAMRLADYDVDLAFANALREAREHPPTPTAEQRELMARNFKAESVVKADHDLVARLTRQLASAPETTKDDIQDQIDVAKGQLELDQDELDDAKEDLLRAGANPQGKIRRVTQAQVDKTMIKVQARQKEGKTLIRVEDEALGGRTINQDGLQRRAADPMPGMPDVRTHRALRRARGRLAGPGLPRLPGRPRLRLRPFPQLT